MMPSMRQYAVSLMSDANPPRQAGVDPAGIHSVFVTARFTPGTCNCFNAEHAAAGSGDCAKTDPHITSRIEPVFELRYFIRYSFVGSRTVFGFVCLAEQAKRRIQDPVERKSDEQHSDEILWPERNHIPGRPFYRGWRPWQELRVRPKDR